MLRTAKLNEYFAFKLERYKTNSIERPLVSYIILKENTQKGKKYTYQLDQRV